MAMETENKMTIQETKQILKFANEMDKDEILNWFIETMNRHGIDPYLFFSVVLEQDHVSETPYTWTDYVNEVGS